MTDKTKEALKLALEALEMWCPMTATYLNTRDEAITSIREALAEQSAQQQEAWAAAAMRLAADLSIESLRLGSYERKDTYENAGRASWQTIAIREKREAARECLRQHVYTSPPASKPLTDDPLQGAVDWLLEADGEYFCTATVQRTLRIGYNRAKRLCDTAKERAAHGIKGDA